MSDLITITRRSQLKPGLLARIGRALRGTWIGPFSLKDAKDPALKAALQRLFGDGYDSAAGVTVTRENAFTFSAVFDAVNQISSDVAKLPLNLHKRRKGGGSDHFTDSNLYDLLKHEPNEEQASMVFRRTLVAHALTCHGGYAEIERDKINRPIALWTLTPDRVEPIREKVIVNGREQLGRLVYRIDGSDDHIIPARDMIHIHGLGYDGYVGYDVINKARQAIGLALAAEKFGAQYFGKGTVFGGWLETDEDLDPEQKAEIRKWIQEFREQQDSAFRVLVTEAGRKFHQFTNKPSDSQMDELRVRQVEEVARFFRMPPHRLGVNTPGTVSYASVEMANLDYYTGALLDWITLVEQEFNRKLIPRLERRQQFIKHNVNAFLRGTIRDRYEALGIARDKGVINADEWRDLEDMNPQEGGQGSLYLVQSAQVPLNKLEALADAEIKSRTAKSNPPDSTPPAPAPAPTNTPDNNDDRDALIAELRERLARAEEIVTEAQQRAADLREHIAAAEAAGGVKDETIAILRESEQKQQDLAASTLAIAAGLRAELEAAQTAKVEAESEARAQTALAQMLEAERDAALERVTKATVERDRLASEADQARASAEEASQRAADVAADKDASDAARQAAEQLAREARAAADVADAARTAAEATVSELERARTDAERRLSEFTAQLEQESTARAEAERQAAAARAAVEATEAALGEAQQRLTDVQQARADAEQQLADVTARVGQESTARVDAERQAAEARTALEATEAALLAAQQTVSEVQQASADAEQRLAEVTAQVGVESAAREDAERQAQEAAQHLLDAQGRMAALQAERDRLAADGQQASEAAQQACMQATELEQTCAALRQQIDTLETTHVAGESERSQLRESLAALERERGEAMATLAQREAEATADAARLAEIDAARLALEQSAAAARAAADDATQRAAVHEQAVRAAEQRAADEASAKAAAEAAKADAERRAADLEAALETQRRAERDRLAGVITAHRGLIVDALGRMTRRECQQARSKQATPEKLRRWLEGFPTLHEAICVEALTPAIRTHLAWRQSADDPVAETERLVREHIAAFVAQIRAALEADPEDFHAVLDRVLTRWETERAAAVADAVLAEEIRYVREQ